MRAWKEDLPGFVFINDVEILDPFRLKPFFKKEKKKRNSFAKEARENKNKVCFALHFLL